MSARLPGLQRSGCHMIAVTAAALSWRIALITPSGAVAQLIERRTGGPRAEAVIAVDLPQLAVDQDLLVRGHMALHRFAARCRSGAG
jgi:hypothetical protein